MEEIRFSHVSVLLRECIEALQIKPNGIYVDCTTGGGGHSLEIAKRLTDGGRLIAIDRDEDALRAAGKRLADFADRVTFVHSNYAMLQSVLADLGIPGVDGVLADLGVSSYQLDTAERGFSYMQDAPLDMRMDREQPLRAYDVVNTYSEEELRRIFYDFGEEKFARNIAANIVKKRSERPIETTLELAELVKASMPKTAREGGHHPAKRTFQAIRIEVNSELSSIPPALDAAVHALNPGGRIAVITFHSLEDRLVKQKFAALSSGCTCPREFPVCVCGKKPVVRVITKKPVTAGEDELAVNPRSRSAKLRVAEKI
jgi:16S rRNA (cytosine1402-N4)-methyltransferase